MRGGGGGGYGGGGGGGHPGAGGGGGFFEMMVPGHKVSLPRGIWHCGFDQRINKGEYNPLSSSSSALSAQLGCGSTFILYSQLNPADQKTQILYFQVGLIIGKGGEQIKQLQEQSGCKIVIIQGRCP